MTAIIRRTDSLLTPLLCSVFVSGVASSARFDLPLVPDPQDAAPAAAAAPVQSCAPPLLAIRPFTTNQIVLRWDTCTNAAYQIEHSLALTNWDNLGAPLAAQPGGEGVTRVVQFKSPAEFFRIRLLTLTNSVVPTDPGQHLNLDFVHDGLPRSYSLVIPSNYTGLNPVPLALILHGHGQTANSFANRHPNLFVEAEAQGMIVALPNGLEVDGDSGWHSRDPVAGEQHPIDDVGFLLALIERLDDTLNLDSSRIYAGGFSAGGAMCHYLGARTTNVFAALAAVASGLGRGPLDDPFIPPPAAGPMPVLLVNATNDCRWPYGGGLVEGQQVTSAFEAAVYWTQANECTPPPTVATNVVIARVNRILECPDEPPTNEESTNLVATTHWTDCLQRTEVVFVTLTDGGHQWPDAADGVGLDANQAVVSFFLRHSRSTEVSAPVGAENVIAFPAR